MALLGITAGTFFFLLLLWFSARGAITVCVLEVTNGEMVVSTGGIAPRVLNDLRDVVRKPRVRRATISVMRAREHASLNTRGDISEVQLQQLRNIVGSVPLAKLANDPRKRRRA